MNLFFFFVSKRLFEQTDGISLLVTFIVFLISVVAVFIIGDWPGLAIMIVSIGMLAFIILVGIILVILDLKSKFGR